MGAFFESALLFSLAVLIVLIGLLVYYFKGRVTELEQNNAKCLEIISDVYNSHAMLKQTVTAMLMEAAEDSVHDEPLTAAPAAQAGGYINVEIEEREPDDSSRVSYTDDESMGFDVNAEDLDIDTKDLDTKDYKMIHVDLDAHDDTYELDEEEMDEDNEDVVEQVILDESAPNIQVLKSEAEVDRPVTPQTIAPLSEDYKKMSAVALRGYIISKGIQTDTAKLRRMNKQELIDLVTQAL